MVCKGNYTAYLTMSIGRPSFREADPIFEAEARARDYGLGALDLTTGTLFDENGKEYVPMPAVIASELMRNDLDLPYDASYYAKGKQQMRLGELALDFLHKGKSPPIS